MIQLQVQNGLLHKLFAHANDNQGAFLIAFKQGTGFSYSPKKFCTSIDQALAFIEQYESTHNLYFNANLIEKPSSGRGDSDNARLMIWAYADLDTDDGVHSGGRPSKKAVADMLKSGNVVPIPSYVVNTGGGLHAYWLLDKPIDLTTDRQLGESIQLGINNAIRAWHIEQKAGFKYERLKDLARVLRVPGSLNHKTDPAKQVKLLLPKGDDEPIRYTPFDLPLADLAIDQKADKPLAEQVSGDFREALKACLGIPCVWHNDGSGYLIKMAKAAVLHGVSAEQYLDIVRTCTKDLSTPKCWTNEYILERYKSSSSNPENVFGSAIAEKPKAASVDSIEIAEKVIEQYRHTDGHSRLIWHAGKLALWSQGKYKYLDSDISAALLTKAMRLHYSHISRNKIGDVENDIRALTLGDDLDAKPPMWLIKHKWKAAECFVTSDKVVHLPSLIDSIDENYSCDATPALFTTAAANYPWPDSNAECPEWLKFLKSAWPEEPECIRLLRQWFGYCLVLDNSQEKALYLYGAPRSGKGTICRVLKKMIGEDNTAGPRMSQLGGQFGLAALLGKSVAIVDDARLSQRADTTSIIEAILTITGNGDIEVDRKHRESVKTKLPTRFLFCSNELPNFVDSSGALLSRMLFLHMPISNTGREDRELSSRLEKELPGILRWAIEGYADLQRTKRFVEPSSSQRAHKQFEEISSPVAHFVNEYCELGPDEETLHDELFQAYRDFCYSMGKQSPNKNTFTRQLTSAFTKIDPLQKESQDSADKRKRERESQTEENQEIKEPRKYVYRGIKLLRKPCPAF